MTKAMTYLEVILALIIISIVATISYPKYDDDRLDAAADELIAKMKYASYLATLQDNFDAEDMDFRAKLWQIRFNTQIDGKDVIAYSIFKDTNGDGKMTLYKKHKDKFLFDTIAGKEVRTKRDYLERYSASESKSITNKSSFLNVLYGVDSIEFPKNCKRQNSQKLMFDKYGQVYTSYTEAKHQKSTNFFLSKLGKPECLTYKLVLKQGNNKVGICIDTRTSYIRKCPA